MDELQQVDLRGTVFVNPNKGDTASLPYVVRYDKAEESDEEMDLQGLGVDLFFEETPAEVPAPHVRMSESQSDLSAAAGVLTIHTDEVHPDRDIVGTGGWALVWGRGQSGVEVYGVNKPDGRNTLSPGTFPHELGRLLMRYGNGRTADKGRKVKMSNHWTTDGRLLQGGLCAAYAILQERFASPLNYSIPINNYWSAYNRDRLFGAHFDAFSSRFAGCAYISPEYEEVELEKALQWAIWPPPSCVFAFYPRWGKARYVNLLAHPNVRVLARFARGTFAFLPPDRWSGGAQQAGTANWQVLVLEIANSAGRVVYTRGGSALVEAAGRLMGAKRINQGCENTGTRKGTSLRWADPSDLFVRTRQYDGSTLAAPTVRSLPPETLALNLF
eukprot:5967582-Pyramimonas_sp.AAC.1